MVFDADVIISGAGPAGTMAAHSLARKGIRVLILEKSPFPRYKTCGAGLTHKILGEIPFDLTPVIETTVHTFRFSSCFSEVFSRTSSLPLMYCTMRDRLDGFMLEQAVSEGSKVLFGEKVIGVEQGNGCVTVKTRSKTLHARLVIGADGATSMVARMAGLRKDTMPGMAWEAEVAADPGLATVFSDTVFLDWGTFPGGYGWVFPKNDHFSVGVGGPASLSRHMMTYYSAMMRYLEGQIRELERLRRDNSLKSPRDARTGTNGLLRVVSLKSWPIPVKIRKSAFHNGLVLVAGDAAGLTDPLTGEGIYYAVRSGKLAAEACFRYLQSGNGDLTRYSQRVNDELMPELLEANRIRAIFNTVPLRIHHFIRDHDRAWRAFGKVLRGERWYADVRMGFGRWKFLWGAACRLAGLISQHKENRFSEKGFNNLTAED